MAAAEKYTKHFVLKPKTAETALLHAPTTVQNSIPSSLRRPSAKGYFSVTSNLLLSSMQKSHPLLLSFVLSGAAVQGAPLEFNRDIRPILSDKCFGCHGPDSGHRKAGLRLDQRDAALKPAKSGDIPLTPGNPAASQLLARVLSSDKDEVMPPPEAKLERLTKTETETLRRWISEGAQYQPLWSFIPPKSASLAMGVKPSLIDHLIQASLSKRGLTQRPEARPEALLRRASLDLTGLPPSASEVRAYLADPLPGAYERAVDRLLQSPSYGERWTADWLDLARYADSFGFQVDRDRSVWPWRDWVVDAFNRNLPFNDFVTWQLAGDLLPNPSEEQILATAFNRLHQQEAEGGSVEEEYRVEYISDRVQTFGTAFLGLTFECAKCHDHKFDPISQKEFYQMFAFFDDIDEAGLYSFFTSDAPTPATRLLPSAAKTKLSALEAEAAAAEKKLSQSWHSAPPNCSSQPKLAASKPPRLVKRNSSTSRIRQNPPHWREKTPWSRAA
jgi:Protein of unknown function (DUF1549)/Planctomycete cytochrome C